MTASIMMVTYNRLPLTKQTLESLFETTAHPFNLIIVDNGSSDETLKFLYEFLGDKLVNSQYFKSFNIQANTTNLGIAYGRNQALSVAEDEWLCTLDNDVILPKGWLTECIEILQENSNFGMIGVNFEKHTFPLITRGNKTWQRKPEGNLGTACMVFPRNLFSMIGYFNHKDYNGYAHEDAEYGFRARLVGYELGYIKENGIHLGEGEQDKGEYRVYKDQKHKENLPKFYENCRLFIKGKKSIYQSFKKNDN